MYTIYVKFECVDKCREAFIERMKAEGILDAIRHEKGCVKYDYYLSAEDENQLLLLEQWETKEHQQIHIDQPHMDKMREFKNDYILSTVIGEIELK